MKINLRRLIAFGFILLVTNVVIGQEFWKDSKIFEKKTFDEIVRETEAYYSKFDEHEQKPGYKPYKRWAMSAGMRLGADGNFVNAEALIFDEYDKFLKSNKKATSRFNSGNWVEEGPFGYLPEQDLAPGLGRINCIAFHPVDPNILFVGSAGGGLWKSEDNGLTWEPLTDGMPSIGISGITIDPDNPSRIWLLTGDGDGSDSFSIGILYSSNGGVTWEKTGFNFGYSDLKFGYKLIANPEDINTQFAVMQDGVFKTNDGWVTSVNVHAQLSFDLAYKPGDTSIVYATTEHGFYKSIDGGQNFIITNPGGILPLFEEFSRAEVETTPDNPNVVYIFYGGGDLGFPGFFKSVDSGDNWEMTTDFPNICSRIIPFDTNYDQAEYDHVLAVDPNNEDIIYTGAVNVFKSINGGDEFELSAYRLFSNEDYPYVHADIHALAFNNGTLYVGCDGGLFKTSDGGASYQDISEGLRITQFYNIDVVENQVMGGCQDNGTITIDFAETNLAQKVLWGDGFFCLYNYFDPTIFYASTQANRYRFDPDTMFNITPDITGVSWQQDFIMDPLDPQILFTARNNVYRTKNEGGDWQNIEAFDAQNNGEVTAMIQGISFRDRLYVAKNSALVRSDNALSENPDFVDLSDEVITTEFVFISDMAVNPQNSTKLYITYCGFDADNKVWYKDDLDSEWTNLPGNLPNVPVYSIVYHAGSENGIFIGTEIGVFYRDDNLPDWQYYGNNLPSARVYDLKILPGDEIDRLFVGTYGRGIWSTEIESMECKLSHNLSEANNLGDSDFDGVKVYEADQSIISTRKIEGGYGTNVLYSAGDFIQLNPGFRASHKSIFTAVLNGCTGTTLPSAQ